MKRWLLLCLVCLPLAARAQDVWPRNAKNEIEFAGVIPWPANAQSEAQRRALVRCWYEEKLTDMEPADIYSRSMQSRRTCCGLPDRAYFPDERPGGFYRLSCSSKLTPTKTGLEYQLFGFLWSYGGEDWGISLLLKDALTQKDNTPEDLASLAVFRNRIAKVLAGW